MNYTKETKFGDNFIPLFLGSVPFCNMVTFYITSHLPKPVGLREIILIEIYVLEVSTM